METNNLFVYGILVDDRPGKNAILRDHERINVFGYWTIIPKLHRTVHGVLFENISDDDFFVYDRIEGVSNGFYFRKHVDVEVYEEERIAETWVYQMNSENLEYHARGVYDR